MDGAGQVLQDLAEDRRARVRIEQSGDVLVDGAEHPGLALAALQAQVLRLQAAAPAKRTKTSVEGVQVEDGDLDRGRPEVPPLLAEQDPAEPPSLAARPGPHHPPAPRDGGGVPGPGWRRCAKETPPPIAVPTIAPAITSEAQCRSATMRRRPVPAATTAAAGQTTSSAALP